MGDKEKAERLNSCFAPTFSQKENSPELVHSLGTVQS